ncbi:MAG: GNAT family N-acetyltransferase [Hyphomicrobiaceae bacterium]|nr:GNAT family N-acetyltransferase [Hyphomicrobiaceae bacterium]
MNERTLKIRKSTNADIPRITEIYARSVREETASFELIEPNETEMAKRRKALLEEGYPHLVAEVNGHVVGYAYAGAFRPRPAYGLTVESTVYVDPDIQRGGIGRALMRRVIEECKTRGFRQMIAIVGGSDHTASIAFHKSLGFVDAGTVKSVGYKHGKWLDTVYLQLALGPGDATPPDKIPGG